MSTKNFRKLLADNSFPRVVTAEIAMTYDGIIGIGSKLLYKISARHGTFRPETQPVKLLSWDVRHSRVWMQTVEKPV